MFVAGFGPTMAVTVLVVALAMLSKFIQPMVPWYLERGFHNGTDMVWDFFLARYKPHLWYFAMIDLIRRVISTTVLLLMPDSLTQMFMALFCNAFFAVLYRWVWLPVTSQPVVVENP